MRTTSCRLVRLAALAAGTAILLATYPATASAAPKPAQVTDLTAALGVRGVVLSWATAETGTPVVRDVTGLPGGYAETDGRAVPASATSAYDTGFGNTSRATYAVWAADSDGNLSTFPTEITVDPLPPLETALSLNIPVAVVAAGKAVALTGAITRAGLPFAGAKVALRSTIVGATAETTLATITSSATGALTATYVPNRSRTYRFVFAPDVFSEASVSVLRRVNVQSRIYAAFSPATMQWTNTSILKGVVTPALPGKAVAIQRRSGSTWVHVTSRVLTSTSTYSFAVKPGVGRYYYRVVLPSQASYLGSMSLSTVLTVIPRTLKQGMSGPDVLTLEKRLAVLRYDIGKVDGVFDYDTRHAVTAFQKVERLSRTGIWAAVERTRVVKPLGFTLRYASTGRVAEVSITRQVLVIHEGGVILRIADVSTGNEAAYYQEGVRNVAHTPRGVFRVYYKINGIRVSKLGELYKPSYFFKGWAIHGSASVPTYPASHGCVRITNPAADRLFSLLRIGTKVAVYDD